MAHASEQTAAIEESAGPWYETADLLMEEARQATEERERRLCAWTRQVKELHGRYYRGDRSERPVANPSPKNFGYSWITRALPEMAWENPRVEVEAIGPGVTARDALLRKVALNQWIQDVDLATVLADGPFLHAQFNAGYLLVSPEPIRDMRPVEVPPVGGWDDRGPRKRQPMRPSVYAIPPTRVFEDPAATCRDEIRFIGWDWWRPKASLLEEAKAHPKRGWNVDLINRMDVDSNGKTGGARRTPSGVDVRRGEIHGQTIWIPEAKIDTKNTSARFYHGALYTLPGSGQVSEDEDEWLRDPRDFYGPACGPIHAFGVYVIPGYAGYMGPITGVQEQAESLAATAAANTRSARAYKVVVILDEKDGSKLVNTMRSAKHHHVYSAKGFKKDDVLQVAMGGVSDQSLVQEQREQENLDDVSGMSELRRGNVTGRATATENAIAADNASARFDWINKRMYLPTQRVLQAVCEYFEHSADVLFPLSGESAAALGHKPMRAFDREGNPVIGVDGKPVMLSRTFWFQGGRSDESATTSAKVRIVPKSMSRKNQAQEQQSTVAFYQWLASMLPAFRAFPEVAWADVVNDFAEAVGLPKLAHRIDWELVEVFAEQQYGMQITMQQAELARAPAFEGMQGPGTVVDGGWWRNASPPGARTPGGRGAAGLGSPAFSTPLVQGGAAQPPAAFGAPRSNGAMKQPRPPRPPGKAA